MGLAEELERAGEAAAAHAGPDEELTAVLAAQPLGGERVYVCSFERGGDRTWLALDEHGTPLAARAVVREAVSIAAMCEIAEDAAGGGDLDELRRQLVTVRLTEAPPGIEEAEEAALALERTLDVPPRVASPAYLDAIGAAARRLELALGEPGPSPFAAVLEQALPAIAALASEVEEKYKGELR